MRVLACAAFAALALAGGVMSPVRARPFTVEDLLAEESLGETAVDPSGRWAVFERRAPFVSAEAYRYGMRMEIALSTLWVVDLQRSAPARPLLRPEVGPGVVIAGFSPTGRSLAVYRLSEGRWTLGVVTLATGAVRWLDVTPDWLTRGRTLQWLSDDRLLVLARTDGQLPWILRQFGIAAERYPELWAATQRGEASVKVLGSGAYLGLRDRGAPLQLLEVDVRSGIATERARGAFTDLEVSPNGRHAALLETTGDLQPRAAGPAQGGAGLQTQAQGLVLVDLATGARTEPVAGVDVLPNLLAWSPRSRALLVYGRDDPGGLWSTGRLRVVGTDGAAAIVDRGAPADMTLRPEVVSAGWLGEAPIVYARPPGAGRSDWYRLGPGGPVNLTAGLTRAPRALAAVDAGGLVVVLDEAAWRIDRGGGAVRLAGRHVRPAPPPPRLTPLGRLDAQLPASSWLLLDGRLAQARAGGVSPLGLPRPAGDLVAVTRDGLALTRRQDASGTTRLERLSRAGVTPLLTINAASGDLEGPRVRAVRHPGPDGVGLTSWLFLPLETGGPPPPLLIVPYQGARYPRPPRDIPGEPGDPLSVRVLTGHGYAVLMPSLPLPPGAEPMAGIGPRLLEIVATAEAQPDLAGAFDPQRLALWGFSFGGYTVAAALTQTDAFRAGVAIAGPMEFTSKWASTHPSSRPDPRDEGVMLSWSAGNMENGQNRMYAPPWADPERYRRNSPFMAADRIRTPLMLVSGDQDSIDLQQSEAMFAALYRQSKDAILLTYWGETHAFASPGNIRDLYARAFAFLDAHLGVGVSGPSAPSPAHPGSASASGAPRPRPPPPTRDAARPGGR